MAAANRHAASGETDTQTFAWSSHFAVRSHRFFEIRPGYQGSGGSVHKP